MNRFALGDTAPNFTLPDHQGQTLKLSEIYRTQHVLLVFNLGFL